MNGKCLWIFTVLHIRRVALVIEKVFNVSYKMEIPIYRSKRSWWKHWQHYIQLSNIFITKLVTPLERYRYRYHKHILYVVWDYRCPSSTTISIYIMASPSYQHPIFADETDSGNSASGPTDPFGTMKYDGLCPNGILLLVCYEYRPYLIDNMNQPLSLYIISVYEEWLFFLLRGRIFRWVIVKHEEIILSLLKKRYCSISS
jgi:hypothetical protein